MKSIFPTFAFFLFSAVLISQNRIDFFKVFVPSNLDLPVWAQQMYEADPNVYEVEQAYKAYYQTYSFEKNIHTQNFKFWLQQVSVHLNEQGLIRLPDPQEGSTDQRRIFERYLQGGTLKNNAVPVPIVHLRLLRLTGETILRQTFQHTSAIDLGLHDLNAPGLYLLEVKLPRSRPKVFKLVKRK